MKKTNRGIKIALILVVMFAVLTGCSTGTKSGLSEQEIATLQLDNKSMKEQIQLMTNKIQVKEETMISKNLILVDVIDPYKDTELAGMVESYTLIFIDSEVEPSVYELSIEDGDSNSLLSAVKDDLTAGKTFKVVYVGVEGISNHRTVGKVARIQVID